MKKNIVLISISFAAIINMGNVFANDNAPGHVATIYGGLLRSTFGECVHTAFYNPDTDALSECGEVIVHHEPLLDRGSHHGTTS